MLTFIKLGGSVITDKTRQEVADTATIQRLAAELAKAHAIMPDLKLIVAHGSGSFGHVAAQRYGVHRGISADGDWMGYARTSAAALRLNRIVVDELLAAGLPALALQPSASLSSRAGQPIDWCVAPIERALGHNLVPIIHGDVSFDLTQGSAIISTEQLLDLLARTPGLAPSKIILVGESGVYTADPRNHPDAQRIPLITRANIDAVLEAAGASHGIDVTGGMRSKVAQMWRLAQEIPGLRIQLIGTAPGLLERAILGTTTDAGTTIYDSD